MDAIIPFNNVYITESVNLDDGDSATVESPFLFALRFFIFLLIVNKENQPG